MAIVKPFKGIRPAEQLVEKVAELPYDVVDSGEARKIAEGNAYSFFHVSKAEIDMPPDVNIYDPAVYAAGRDNFRKFIQEGVFIQDKQPLFYLYTQIMNEKSQTGLVSCVSIDDYLQNRIKKHELTREDKEKDRTVHLDIVGANTGPVFLFYKEDETKQKLMKEGMKLPVEYDFTADDGIRHILRVVSDEKLIAAFEKAFAKDILYIADGHHRAASAARVGQDRRKADPAYTGTEEFNFFMAVIFPHSELTIMAYNRAVAGLNGLTQTDFMDKLKESFSVSASGVSMPEKQGDVSMYIDKTWYSLSPAFSVGGDPVSRLDVTVLQNGLLQPVLGIDDPRTDDRIKFIGGIRGIGELERLVDSGVYTVAFSMHPTSIKELMEVADAGMIMPPKSTWFEPKLRSGLVVHSIEE